MSKRPVRPSPHPGPRVQWIQKAKTNDDADDAIFLASSYGLTPDDWQIGILYAWLGRRKDGKWCHGRCGLAVPRQNGKNGAIEIRELFGMVVLGEAFLHTAHEVKTARKAFKRLKHFFGNKANDPQATFPELNALVLEVRSTNGQEAIILKDVVDEDGKFVRRGGSIEFVARSSGSGRGFTVDVLVLDEAQHLDDDELEAIRSAVSSAPLGNPQVIYAGTPPNPEKGESGVVWNRIRALAGKDKRLAWIEYGAPDGPMPDLEDVALLFATNPALELRHGNGAFGLQMDTINDERGELSPEGYARERLGWWGNPGLGRRGVIDMTQWVALKVQADQPTTGLVVVDVSPDLGWTSISVASAASPGRALVLVDRLEGTMTVTDEGTTDEATVTAAEAVAAVAGNLDKVLEVALTPTAQILSAQLTRLGLKHKQLLKSDLARSCTAFQDMVRTRTVAHVGQQVLDDAIRNAITRYVGDGQEWDRRNRRLDISALIAGSTAAHRHALLTAAPKAPPPPPRRAGRTTTPRARNAIATAGF